MSKIVAFARASGLIGFGETCPTDALPLMSGDEKEVRHEVEVLARHSRTNDDLFVPGIPEASNEDDALIALVSFIKLIETRKGK